MKHTLLLALITFALTAHGQNIDDNKVTFSYIQLPSISISKNFTKYEVRTEHDYNNANQDSLMLHQAREEMARKAFEEQLVIHKKKSDSITRAYYSAMATWERNANLGVTNPDGSTAQAPTAPVYPPAPTLYVYEKPLLHTQYEDNKIKDAVKLSGYEKGLGGFIVTFTVHGIRHTGITETKKNSGADTKYEYKAGYVLPITIKVETPTQGVILDERVLENVRYHALRTHKTAYDHQLYLFDNKEKIYQEIEEAARAEALQAANQILNDKIGFVDKNRVAELYSVKNHKGYDYSDVTAAYSKTIEALLLVKNDRLRKNALAKIDEAIAAWSVILQESDLNDNKSRINDKITAMIQCNLAELYAWKGDFNQCDLYSNLILNSGEGKAKRHIRDEIPFYNDQKIRWNANQ